MSEVINKIKKYLPNYLVFLLMLFTIFLIIVFSKYNCILYDDFIECSYSLDEGIFDSLLPGELVHGGGYTTIFLTKLMTFGIPYMFKIHPEDFISTIAPLIKGFLYSIIFFISVKCVLIRNKSNWLFFFSMMFLTFYLIYFLHRTDLMSIHDNITFFRYVFCTLFYFIFFSYIYQTIVYKSTLSIIKILVLLFSIVTVASNLETIIFSFCLFFVLIIMYNLIIHYIYFFDKNKNIKRIYKYRLSTKFYLPVALFYIITFLYTNSSRYYANFHWRGFGDFIFLPENVIEFFYVFCKLYILDNIVFWALLITLIIIFVRIKGSIVQKKKLICILFMIFSINAVYFSLIIFGKNSYEGNYWISDVKLFVSYKILLLAPAFLILDDVLKHINIKYKKMYLFIVSFFLFIVSLYYAFCIYNNRNNFSSCYIFKKVNYINEKMYRFFYLKGETPYLIKENPIAHDTKWVPFPFIELMNQKQDIYSRNELCSYEETRTSVYIQKTYDVRLSNGVKYCLSNDAFDKFTNSGGVISRKELMNLKFSNLKNPEFVLNDNLPVEDKMTKEEIMDIYTYLHR